MKWMKPKEHLGRALLALGARIGGVEFDAPKRGETEMALTASTTMKLINAGLTRQQADALVAIARRTTPPRSRAEEAAKLETAGFSIEQAHALAEIFIAENSPGTPQGGSVNSNLLLERLTAIQATLADMSNDIRDIKAEARDIKLVQNLR